MENQEDWFVLLGPNSLLYVLLVLCEKFSVKLNVTRFVNAMNVAETSSNGEIWGDRRKSFVDGKNVLRLGVERVVVDIFVVNAIFLTTGDANLLELYVRYVGLNRLVLILPSQAIASWAQHVLGT